MCGCCSRAVTRISRLNRSKLTPAARSGDSTLTTTRRPSASSSARNTRLIPPPPSSRSRRYASLRVVCSRSRRSVSKAATFATSEADSKASYCPGSPREGPHASPSRSAHLRRSAYWASLGPGPGHISRHTRLHHRVRSAAGEAVRERACFGRAAPGHGRSSIHVLAGVVQRCCFAAPGTLTRRVSYRPSAASSDVTGARLHQFPGGTGPIAHAYCGWQAPRGGHSPLSGWDVQLQPHAAGDVLASWGRGGVVEGVGRGVS